MTATASVRKKIGIASLIMMTSVFLSRVTGLAREMVIAYIGGTGALVDAYQVAFIIPEMLNHVLASGFLSVTFIPIFSEYLARDRIESGWELCHTVLTVLGSLLLIMVVAAVAGAPQLVQWLAPGIDDPAVMAAAVKMTRIIIPAQFFFFAGGIFMAVQFSHESFLLPALAPLVYNLGIIGGGLLLGPVLGMEGFSWGVLAGAFFGNFVLQYAGARRLGYGYKMRFDVFNPDLKRYLLLTLPLMLGLTMTFSTEFFMRFFGSYLERGNIAAVNYAVRILFILVGLFGQAVGVASFPYLARLAAEEKIQQMNRLLNDTLKLLTVVMPVSVLFMVLRNEVVSILFEHGRFDAASTRMTKDALVYLMLGAYAFSAQTIVVRGFFAVQNTLLPAVFGTLAVAASLPLYFMGVTMLGISGLALAISVSATIQIFLIYGIWNRKYANAGAGAVYAAMVKMAALSLPLGLFLEWLRKHLGAFFDGRSMAADLIVAVAVSALFTVAICLMGYVLKIGEIQQLVRNGFARSQRKPAAEAPPPS